MTPAIARKSLAPVEPLCVDLDGTLIRTDLLFETFLSAFKRQWWICLLVPYWLLRGRAVLKEELARRASLDASLLPYRENLLFWLRREHAEGRRLILTTGADLHAASAVAGHLGIFERVIASDGVWNLTGRAKSECLVTEFGEGGFDYAGDSGADAAVWNRARVRIAAGAAARHPRAFEISFPDSGSAWRALVKALRPRHWIKNLLVFIPLVTSHSLQNATLFGRALLAFAAFSLTASAVYLINDLLDLDADRRHPVKRRRPFAAGQLSIRSGLLMAPVLLTGGLGIASFLGVSSLAVLTVYLGLTFLYTLYLKQKLLADVFTLAGLYTIRMLEGGAAANILCSVWLLAFAVFQFLSLAFLKRSAELCSLARARREAAAGRNYFTWDLVQINAFGVSAAYVSSMVLGLYIASENVRLLYRHPMWLWLLAPLHLFWMSRAWILSHRGAMDEDPILFASTDRVTWGCALIGAAALAIATFGPFPIPGVA